MTFIMCVLMFLFAFCIIIGLADIVTYRQYNTEKRKSLEKRLDDIEKKLSNIHTDAGRG